MASDVREPLVPLVLLDSPGAAGGVGLTEATESRRSAPAAAASSADRWAAAPDGDSADMDGGRGGAAAASRTPEPAARGAWSEEAGLTSPAAPGAEGEELPPSVCAALAHGCWRRLRERAASEAHYAWRRRQGYSLALLRKFPALILLAAWHTYGIWLAFCAIVCMAGNTFLSWYVGWYQMVPSQYTGGATGGFPYRVFFAIFLRSWLLVHITSQLCRFCYVLFTDAWSLDAFGAYRRALCGYAHVDMWSEESMDSKGHWPDSMLTSRRLWLDTLCQWAIYASLDVVPVIYGVVAAVGVGGWDSDTPAPLVAMFQALLNCTLLHVAIFLLAVALTDVHEKVTAFSKAWTHDRMEAEIRGLASSLQEAEVEAPCVDALVLPPESTSADGTGRAAAAEPSAQQAAAWKRCLRVLVACRRQLRALRLCRTLRALARPRDASARTASLQSAGHASWSGEASQLQAGLVDRQTQTEATSRDPVAERLSQCVRLCGWLDVLAWEVVFVAVVAGLLVAAWALKTVLYLALCVVGVLAMLFWRCRWALASEERWEKSRLQQWGETHCSLSPSERWDARTGFGMVIILQGVLFGMASQWTGLWVCVTMLCLMLVREVVLQFERNSGWWIGLSEGFVFWLAIVLISPSMPDVLLTLLLACLHQFGLGRFMHKGARLVKVINGLMYIMLVMIVGATLLSVAPAENSSWSSFTPGGQNYTIFPKDVRGLGMTCEGSYASGEDGVSFSLVDFALWSSLAYESPRTMPAALQHFFPGWKIAYSRIASHTHGAVVKSDWTTFFEYSDPANLTSIVAIRGTDTTLDVLNDINIWLTAALMEGFEILGPWMWASVSQFVAYQSVFVRGTGASNAHFSELLRYVQRRLREEPQRRFYITGHSLGGGLAKLVASRAKVKDVTFMAPGIGRTRYTVFRAGDVDGYIGSLGLTVQPRRDLVSRVDTQLGTVVPTSCYRDPLSCHMIYEGAICPMVQQCGSMRGRRSLVLPCGQCTLMPC